MLTPNQPYSKLFLVMNWCMDQMSLHRIRRKGRSSGTPIVIYCLVCTFHLWEFQFSLYRIENSPEGYFIACPKRFASPGMECAIENIENRHHHLHDYWRCMKHTLWDARCKTFLWSGCRWYFKHGTESKPLIQHHKTLAANHSAFSWFWSPCSVTKSK